MSCLFISISSDRFSSSIRRSAEANDRDRVIDHTDLTIAKGDFAVISGRSGSGKSTLLLLLLGVFAPTGGSIGIELNNGTRIPADRHTRKLFAYVPQGKLLLSGTLRENIAFVRSKATDEEIMAAAEVSCAAEFIRASAMQRCWIGIT